jgi:hypothetical protein
MGDNMAKIAHHLSSAITGTVIAGSTVKTDIAMIEIGNTTAAVAYVQFFWAAAADVTLGTTVPNAVIIVPASGGVVLPFNTGWQTGGTAWSMASTTTATGSTNAAQFITIWRNL